VPSFTSGERRALLFLLALAALGTLVQLYQRHYPAAVTTYRMEFDTTTVAREPMLTSATDTKIASGIDPNRAPAEDLELLPGIGPTLAQAIVTYRRDHPAFKSAEDLLDVPGIGPKSLARFRDRLTFP
jgi:competence ComEA-like helix-hairpin-helix protein